MKTIAIAILTAILLLVPTVASATFSIVACDETKACGAAVATNNLAVGATVIYAKSGTGALATQFETNPVYGPRGLALLAERRDPKAVLDRLLAEDGDFDGQDIGYRQVGLVSVDGRSAAYTGKAAQQASWAGALSGPDYAVQGNGLAGPDVLAAMRLVFLEKKGPLAERLLCALEAGQAAGGQSTGRLSAALLVRTPDGVWQDIDLRVDAAASPLTDLRKLLNMHYANDALVRADRAQRANRREEVRDDIAEAIRLSAAWDRTWRRVARLDMQIGDRSQALQALAALMSVNPAWGAIEIEDPIYAPLKTMPEFRRLPGVR